MNHISHLREHRIYRLFQDAQEVYFGILVVVVQAKLLVHLLDSLV